MFLAVHEMKFHRLRYGLIVGMVALIGYLILMLMGLMTGLGNENTAAIKSWQTQTVFLNKNANENLNQSMITQSQVGHLNRHEALVGTIPVVMNHVGHHSKKQSMYFLGLKQNQYIAKDQLKLVAGHQPRNQHQIILDESLKDKGYQVGSKVRFSGQKTTYQVVGLAKDAKLNIAPLAIGSLQTWQQLKGTGVQFAAGGIFADQLEDASRHPQLAKYRVNSFIQKLPGYAAQNMTFEIMIGFLMVISLIVIAIFLYILTMQKLSEYAMLRAQGIPVGTLIRATFAQAALIMVAGVAISLLLTWGTSLLMPAAVPMQVEGSQMVIVSLGLIIIGTVGALLPVRVIMKISPLDAI